MMIEQADNQSGGECTAHEAPTAPSDCEPEPPPRQWPDERPLDERCLDERCLDERCLDEHIMPAAARRISVEILHAAGDWSPISDVDELIHDAAAATAQHPALRAGPSLTVALALSDDTEIQDLNNRYRGQDKPTNVLSFPALPEPARLAAGGSDDRTLGDRTSSDRPSGDRPSGDAVPEDERFMGDIILAAQTISREAQQQDKPIAHHLQHLVVHGILHLLGFDHESDSQADAMEAIEIDVLQSLKIANPYTDAVPGAIDA